MDIKTISIIATFITSIVSLGTLWNVTKQRLASNRPDIYVKNKSVKIENFGTDSDLPLWESENENDTFSVSLYNIGLGSAKKLRIKWMFDEDLVIRTKSLDKNNNYFIEMGSNFLQYGLKDEVRGLVNLKWDLQQDIDFLLPFKDDNIENINIPTTLMILHSIHTELCYRHTDFVKEGFPTTMFRFEISYMDVNNKKYKKKFKCKINTNTIYDEKSHCYIEIEY